MNTQPVAPLYRKLYTAAVLLLAAILIAAAGWLLTLRYDAFLRWVAAQLHRPQLDDLLCKKIFPPQRFALLQWVAWVVLFIAPFLAWLFIRLQRPVLSLARRCICAVAWGVRQVGKCWRQERRPVRLALVILLLFIAVRSLYYIFNWDLQYDEMWSYNYFTARPLYVSLFMYSNYPLFELSTGLFKYLPLPMKLCLRLPVLLMGLAACIVLYVCVRRYTRSAFTALATTALFAAMPVATFYMLYARGVVFELFFAIVAAFSAAVMLARTPLSGSQQARRHAPVLYILANIGGLYAMPTHVYYWLLLAFTGGVYTFPTPAFRRQWAVANAIVLLGGALCYTPVWIGSGFSFMLKAWQAPVVAVATPATGYVRDVSTFFAGFPVAYAGCFLLALAWAIVQYRRHGARLPDWLPVFLAVLPFLLWQLQHVSIPPRALAFAALAIPLAGGAWLGALRQWKKNFATGLAIALVAGLLLVSHRHPFLNWSRSLDRDTQRLSALLMSRQVTSCYDNSPATSDFYYYYPALEYYYYQQRRSFRLGSANAVSAHYVPPGQAIGYDVVIEPVRATASIAGPGYRLLYADTLHQFSIWTRQQGGKLQACGP